MYLLSSNSLQGIYSTEMYIYVYLKTHRRIFIAVPFVIAKTGKQPNTHHRIGELYNNTIQYCNSNKNEQTMLHGTAWMNFLSIRLNEKSQIF